jgi:hypothetical protein
MNFMQGPTMANPEAFNTVEELRRELHAANETLFSLFFQKAQINDCANEMAGLINNVLIAHLKGDKDAISKLLNVYLGDRDRLREKLEETIECQQLQTKH